MSFTDQELFKRRGRAKAAISRTRTFLESKQNFTEIELNVRLANLDEAWKNFNEFDSLLPEEQSDIEIEEEVYFDTKNKLLGLLSGIHSDKASETQFSGSIDQNTTSPEFGNQSDFKLPRLSIPTFSGNYNDWISFKDLYCTIVHNNERISKIQKFQYLKGLLSDAPADLLKHIPVAEASYDQAWCKLVARYDNKRQIVTSLINTFLQLPNLQRPNESSLRKISDTADEVVRGLNALGPEASKRDPWLIHLILDKLDSETRQLWAQKVCDTEFPSFDELIVFLNSRCSALESFDVTATKDTRIAKPISNSAFKQSSVKMIKCAKCSGNHQLYKCYKFKELDVAARKQFVQKHKLCFNCMSDQHRVNDCPSPHVCHSCKQKHHSTLHEYVQGNCSSLARDSPINDNMSASSKSDELISNSSTRAQGRTVLLPTAIVNIKDCFRKNQEARILLDTGSQGSFISESCVQRLGLKRRNAKFQVLGLSAINAGSTRGQVSVQLSSKYNPKDEICVHAYILNKLTTALPSHSVSIKDMDYLKTVQLADPSFATSNEVDLILGADYFFSLLLPGQIFSPGKNCPMAQNTKFGWILSGEIQTHGNQQNSTVSLSILHSLNVDKELRQFWEIESLPCDSKMMSEEEKFCEDHFKQTYSINETGRFQVKLPFFRDKTNLGNSKACAVTRLLSMENKFKRNSELEIKYKDFLKEYIELEHMTLSTDNSNQLTNADQVYLPHHAVMKPSSTTTKLRVVFDASSKSCNSHSLNSCLGVGAKLQRDLFSILLDFRTHRIAVTSDIEKMYRQILVAPEDRTFQRILWRFNENDKIGEYKLNTVTYGLSSSSFLATRCLQQIAFDCAKNHPDISRIIRNDFYMDDLLTGADTIDETFSICSQLSLLLKERGFNLRKWVSNCPEILRRLNIENSMYDSVELQPTECTKVLGLHWNSKADTFFFVAFLELEFPITKRKLLSQSARIFDPLGFLSPCTVFIKIFYQKLWLAKGDWDSPIPVNLSDEWFKFQKEFHHINSIRIPRYIMLSKQRIQLHGFSDASISAYAAAIYVRIDTGDKIEVNLLVAKTKVAPVKQLSIPRLELCGAHLLALLFESVLLFLDRERYDVFAWSDSKVVLAWIADHPSKWKTFVSNRTSFIQDILPNKVWNYVPSKHNPADIASRGISPEKLPSCQLWWYGPSWLGEDQLHWPQSKLNFENPTEDVATEQRKLLQCTHVIQANETFSTLFEHYSSLSRIVRILAYCRRFIKNCRLRAKSRETASSDYSPDTHLKSFEIDESLRLLLLWVQEIFYKDELKCIRKDLPVKGKSELLSLNPFVDEYGLLRVGGRIRNSDVALFSKHPIILPANHEISKLLVEQYHIAQLHAGPSLLSNIIKQKYWIIGGKRLIRKCVHRCIVCCRFRASTKQQLMGDLPEHRVRLERPFLNCGIDYAGPITLKFNKGRGSKTTKGYIALFICLATKAIHLECVSGLDADSFIAALRRFSSRRGAPKRIFCDNATNFIGAKRKLSEMEKLTSSLYDVESVCYYLSTASIEWKMIPPSSPHFGGLWEANIKSVKYHLKRVASNSLLTYEEMSTLLTQIEAILNSRPLYSMADTDTDSLNVLTPSHFLTGDVLTTIPDDLDSISCSNSSLRDHWNKIQRYRLSFWKSWQRDYLNSLQQRAKWKNVFPNLKVGDLVILKEDNVSPNNWPVGRVAELFKGDDGHVRVVNVRTAKGVFKRSITKIVLLQM